MGKKQIPVQEEVREIERDGRTIQQHIFQRGRLAAAIEEPIDGGGKIDRSTSSRRTLTRLRERAQAVFDSEQSPHNPMPTMREHIIESLSAKSIAGRLCVIIDRMLKKEDGIDLTLAYTFAVSMYEFLNVLGPNDIFAHGAEMMKGQREGPIAKSKKNARDRATAHHAANELRRVAPVFFSTPSKAAEEMLRRGRKGEPGGVTGIEKSTLRGYIGDLCETGQSRT